LEAAAPSRFDGLVNLGIDETSYKKGHKYMTVVVDHDRNRVVWAAKGHGKKVLEGFFKLLTDEQKRQVRCVTADGARWIAECVDAHCPNAVRALDPFHAVSWATDALDEVRRQAWRQARSQPAPKRRPGRPSRTDPPPPPDPAKTARSAKYPLLKNPENLTEQQQAMIELIAADNPRLHRAYRLKEKFRLLLKLPLEDAGEELDRWLAWAQRCRIETFVELGRKIRRHRQAILDTIRLGLSNARVEATNNKIKLTIRMGYGFRNIDNLIAMVMLRCSNLPVPLPGRP
jgi:transposase